jgi:LDH2 family malate/lactate/ureidoglycolate dehydrogenase
MRIDVESLKTWVAALLEASGLEPDWAARVAKVYARASSRAVGHHDITHLPGRLSLIASGWINAKGRPRLISDSGALRAFDAEGCLGELACSFLLDEACALAEAHGIGMACARRSNHFLAAEPYVEEGASRGFLCVIYSNTDPCMAGPAGQPNLIGNNPMGYGAARSGGAPLMLDICMAYASLGNLKADAAAGRSLPPHWAIGASGEPTESPVEALKGGSVLPIGRHKGFGLALLGELITAGVAGGAWGPDSPPLSGGVGGHSQSVIAIKPPEIEGLPAFPNRAAALVGRLRQAVPGLRMPGERSRAAEDAAAREGIELGASCYDALCEWSARLGVNVPELSQASGE